MVARAIGRSRVRADADGPGSVGLTRDAGWQIGVSRTLPVAVATAWELLTAPPGLASWLGDVEAPLVAGRPYHTSDGTTGEVCSRTTACG